MKKKFSNKYLNYIKSNVWYEKRLDIAKKRNYICEMCNKSSVKNFQIHHLTYERLGNELDSDLMFLCTECHSKIHNKSLFKIKKPRKKKKAKAIYIKCKKCNKKILRSKIIKSGYFMCPYCYEDLPKFNYDICYTNNRGKNKRK